MTPCLLQREPRSAIQMCGVIPDSERALESVRWEDGCARVCKCVHSVNHSYTYMYARRRGCAHTRVRTFSQLSARLDQRAVSIARPTHEAKIGSTQQLPPIKSSKRASKRSSALWCLLRFRRALPSMGWDTHANVCVRGYAYLH